MKIKSPYLVKPGSRVRLNHHSTNSTGKITSHEAGNAVLVGHREQLAKLQEVFWASQTKSMLIVLQGLDTAGKDGTISHIFSGVNPQGCDVAAFKEPTPLEERHDFLWRVHAQVPARGMIQIFNRSHYEDVLVPKVHKLLPTDDIEKRMEDINEFEAMLYDNDAVILKFFLHISHKEQTERLRERIEDPDKHWKISVSDFKERRYWTQYVKAYEETIAATSTKHAPWFVIPSDHKWYRNIAISQIIVDAMKGLDLKYPKPTINPKEIRL